MRMKSFLLNMKKSRRQTDRRLHLHLKFRKTKFPEQNQPNILKTAFQKMYMILLDFI